MGLKKQIIHVVLFFCVVFFLAELFLGYYLFQTTVTGEPSASWLVIKTLWQETGLLRSKIRTAKSIGELLNAPINFISEKRRKHHQEILQEEEYIALREHLLSEDERSSGEQNPFLAYRPKEYVGMRIHPFIDYVDTFRLYRQEDDSVDYFGFRNNGDYYFPSGQRGGKDVILIVITGGSEAAGFSHRTPIARNLEKILNTYEIPGISAFKVLNLAMNNYTISNEINAYIHLAYHLHPQFVISHTGHNDMYWGIHVPPNFKKLGLNYSGDQFNWMFRFYDLMDRPQATKEFVINAQGVNFVVDAFLENVAKYQQIVEANSGTLLVGIQGYRREKAKEKHWAAYNVIDELYKELLPKSRVRGYLDFTENQRIPYEDNVHTTEAGSQIIANIYAERILEELAHRDDRE